MRSTITTAGLAATLLLAAGSATGEGSKTMTEMTAFAQSYTRAWSSQDPASVAAHYAEDGSLRINDNEPSVGREALESTAKSFMTELPDLLLTMDALEQDGDRFIYRWTLDGTNSGPGGNGSVVHISGYEEWTMNADGLIQQSQGHMDLDDYARQLAGEAQ